MIKSERARMHRINTVFARVAKTFIILYAIFLTAIWLSERYAFKITTITVTGTHAVSPNEVQQIATRKLSGKLLFWIRRDNLLLYPVGTVLQEIRDAYPRVVHADITFSTRHQLVLDIEEYSPAFLYCVDQDTPRSAPVHSSSVTMSNDVSSSTDIVGDVPPVLDSTLPAVPVFSDCYFADKDAYVFSRAPEYSGFPYLAIMSSASSTQQLDAPSPIGKRILGPVEHARITAFIFALNKLALSTHVVILRNSHDVEFQTDMPWHILWTTNEDPVESAKNLDVVIRSLPQEKTVGPDGLKIIDLRFGNKVFYK